jgi:hypothetical protein
MADTKISDLVSKDIPEYADLLPLVDVSVDQTKKTTFRDVWNGLDNRYISPSFTYDVGGLLTRIDYADTSYKTFAYTSGVLTQIDFQVAGSLTIKRKTLIYSGATLTSINQTIV